MVKKFVHVSEVLMDKDSKAAKAACETLLRELDELVHENFPIGGHANVEKAQEKIGQLKKEVAKWPS